MLGLIFLIAALILMIMAAVGVSSDRVNLVYAAGACLIAYLIVPMVH